MIEPGYKTQMGRGRPVPRKWTPLPRLVGGEVGVEGIDL
jgi:hypothetical protein